MVEWQKRKGLVEAVQLGLEQRVEDLLNVPGRLCCESGRRALYYAVSGGHTGICLKLLATGQFDAHAVALPHSNVSLLAVASCRGHARIVRALLDSGAHVEEDNGECSPLMFASALGHADVVKILCLAVAAIHKRSGEGFTALHYACSGGHVACIKVLLECGAILTVELNLAVTKKCGKKFFFYFISQYEPSS